MAGRTTYAIGALILCIALCLGGCEKTEHWFQTDMSRLLDPSKPIQAPESSPINPILSSVGYADAHEELPPNATFPDQADLTYTDEDYIIGPTDILDISILDLLAEGAETTLRREVENSGFIDLPLVERIMADGKTKEQLRDAIVDAYSPNILRTPIVSVTLIARRQSTFSILGSIARPGTYNVLRKDMRLMEALAMGGGVTRANLRYIYVIRPAPARRVTTAEPATKAPAISPKIPDLPSTKGAESTEPSKPANNDVDAALKELQEAMPGAGDGSKPKPTIIPHFSEMASVPSTGPVNTARQGLPASSKSYKWIYTDGRWVRVEQQAPPASQPSGQGAEPVRPARRPPKAATAPAERPAGQDPFGFSKLAKTDLARVIAINLSKLRSGDPRMNIVMRDNDIIQIPTLEVGEFYVMGEVSRPGVYSLTGREVTVKMAVAAAGNLGPLSWPENSILIRRVGDNQEQIIPLDIEAIFRGSQPDLFLKPDDVLAVGSDVRAPFFAVMRNAFRMTYGFGFIYDRNFATGPSEGMNSSRFRRW